MDQVSDLSKGIRQQVFLTMLNYKRAEVRTDAIDGLVIIGEGGLQVFRMATKDTFPKDVRDAAILELSRHSSSADTGLFKRLAQAGSDDEKMLSMKWLIRNSDKSMAGFFRTLMNGSKGAAVRHMSAVYAVLKSNA